MNILVNLKISIKMQASDLNTQVLEKLKWAFIEKDINEHISQDLIYKYFEESNKILSDCFTG